MLASEIFYVKAFIHPGCAGQDAKVLFLLFRVAGSFIFGKIFFAQTECFRRYFQKFIVFHQFKGIINGEAARSIEAQRFFRGRPANAGQMFFLADIYLKVIFPDMLADDHSFIYFGSRRDIQLSAFLGRMQGVSGGRA